MTKQSKKKMGYKQYEKLLALAHQKAEMLAQRLQTLQSYLAGYVEYQNNTDKYNMWINKRIIEEQDKLQQKEQVSEKV